MTESRLVDVYIFLLSPAALRIQILLQIQFPAARQTCQHLGCADLDIVIDLVQTIVNMRNTQRQTIAAHTDVFIFQQFRARIQIQRIIATLIDCNRIPFPAVKLFRDIIIHIEIRLQILIRDGKRSQDTDSLIFQRRIHYLNQYAFFPVFLSTYRFRDVDRERLPGFLFFCVDNVKIFVVDF